MTEGSFQPLPPNRPHQQHISPAPGSVTETQAFLTVWKMRMITIDLKGAEACGGNSSVRNQRRATAASSSTQRGEKTASQGHREVI